MISIAGAKGKPRDGDGRRLAADEPRARIEDALVDLCQEKPFRRIKLRELLMRAGVDRDAFERCFADLEDCFCQVYKEHRDRILAGIADAVADEPSWRARVRAAAYVLVGYMEEDPRRPEFLVMQPRGASERSAVMMEEGFEEMFDLLDAGRAEREHGVEISRATAEAVGGTIFMQMIAAFQQGSIEAVRAKVPEMMYMAVLPYLGEEAAEEELTISPYGTTRS